MRRLSKVTYISNQSHLILQTNSNLIKNLKIGEKIVTQDLKAVGRIFDIFGPVDMPYVSIKPNKELTEPEKLVGEVLYSFEEKKVRKKR